MSAEVRSRQGGLIIEYGFALAVLLGGLRMAWLTIRDGYFPQPFFFDTDDTWRDWFSVAVWAHETGAYDSWLSIYPPLSFAFLKIVGVPGCYEYAPVTTVRDCDWIGVVALHAIFVVNIFLTARTFLKIDRRTALPRSFSLCASMPMLFGLERGNLVLLCFTFLILGFGPLVKSGRMRWIYVALAVNLKIYLIAAVATQLLRRRWLWVEGVTIAIAVIWLISYMIYGAGTPLEVYSNIVGWAGGSTPGSVLDIWYPNTYLPLRYVLNESNAPINYVLDSKVIDAAILFMPLTTHSAQAAIVLAAAITWLRPEVVPPYRLAFFGVALAMITSETSTYTQPIMFFFVFMEPWRGPGRIMAIIVCYLLCIPGDILISDKTAVISFSFIGNRYVVAEYGIALGMLLRPFLFMLPAYFLSAVTIRDVWVDVRQQGWSTRWRFRSDLPLLPGVLRPGATKPGAAAS